MSDELMLMLLMLILVADEFCINNKEQLKRVFLRIIRGRKVRIMSVIKPTRAYYLCDKKKECSSGWACQNGQCKHTEDVNHALNGPVVNVREWDTRFTLEKCDGLLYYVEKE